MGHSGELERETGTRNGDLQHCVVEILRNREPDAEEGSS